MPNAHVLLVNLGTPRAPTPEAVREFLGEFLSDPMVVDWPRWLWLPILKGIILRRRPARVAEQYRAIWSEEGSPLACGTRRLGERLGTELGPEFRVRPVYRYGRPSLQDALRELLGRGERVLVVPLFPQRTGSSSGTIVQLVQQVQQEVPQDAASRRATLVEIAPDDPGYVEAQAARLRETREQHGEVDHVLCSFHGIPVRYDRNEGGRYRADCQATTRALARRLELPPDRLTLAYQSRFGPERWLRPATADVLARLPRRGVRRLAVMTPGFLTAGLETREEIGIRGRRTFLQAGGEELFLVPAVADHPALSESLARRLGTFVPS